MSRPTLALHIRSTRNVGDVASSPALYFDLPGPVVIRDVREWLAKPTGGPWGLVVAGGGAWRKDLLRLRHHPALAGVPRVAWGVGITHPKRQGRNEKDEHTGAARGWSLYGHRDQGCEGWWVPCASCMHPAFSRLYSVEHEVVYYGHGVKDSLSWARSLGLGPQRTNIGGDLEEVVAFLGSGRTVVTSSYHGVYWGRLLGRTVIPLPRGSKFWHIPKELDLEECRAANRAFHQATLSLLEAVA